MRSPYLALAPWMLIASLGLPAPAAAVTSLTNLPHNGGCCTLFFPNEAATLLSPDGTLIVGRRDDGNGIDAWGNGIRWTLADGWARSTSVGVQETWVDASYTQLGISSDGILLYNQRQDTSNIGRLAPDGVQPSTSLDGYDYGTCQFSFPSTAISSDGTTVVGYNTLCGAHRWTEATGMLRISPLGVTTARATSVSDDGQVVAGQVTSPSRAPWVWTSGGGYQLLPVTLTSSTTPRISGDGSTLVATAVTANGNEAFVWDAANGVTYIGDLPGGTFSSNLADVRADGSMAFGTGNVGSSRPFAWTRTGGMVELPVTGSTIAATPNGLVLGRLISDPSEDDVFVWNPATGWYRSLEGLLRDAGVPVPADGLHAAIGISDDGSTIAGNRSISGASQEPWVATIDVPQCSNGIDDDGDGLADYPGDPGCRTGSSVESPQCDNGVDDDGDGHVDHPADPQCSSRPDNDEARNPASCGLGAELALALGALAAVGSRSQRSRRAS